MYAYLLYICTYIFTYISSLVKCLLKSFTHFIGLFVFLLLSFESLVYIMDTRLLSNTCFANIFSQSGLALHFLSSVFCRAEFFSFGQSPPLLMFYFVHLVFGVIVQESLHNTRSQRIVF